MKRIAAYVLALVLTVSCLDAVELTASAEELTTESEAVAIENEGDEIGTQAASARASSVVSIRVNSPSKLEIIQYLREHNILHDYITSFDIQPSYSAPYVLGKVSDDTLNEALDLLNAVRYIAGIDANVTLNEKYNELAQAASLVNAANKSGLSHYPDRPEGMDDELYELGALGARSSNISAGRREFKSNIIHGWMADSGSNNLRTVGHRRWILNPSMQQTGFGMVHTSTDAYYQGYSAMYAFDNTWGDSKYYGVSWPARNMPVEFFGNGYPWSVSMGYKLDPAAVSVHVRDKGTGQEWNLYEGCVDGYFHVDNGGYGQVGCIIFKPDGISCVKGKQFEVTVSGLQENFSYEVDFFSVEDTYYIGNINSELISFDLNRADNGGYYLNGQIVVVEWVDGNSTVPAAAPVMTFKSTDGTEEIEVFVTATGTNTYYFDRFIEGLSADKEYVFEIASGDMNNISPNRSMNVSLATSPEMVPIKNLGKIGSQKISYYQAGNGELRLYRRSNSYVGNINSELKKTELVTGPNGNYVSGEIVVVEWEDGISTVPFETPVMYFKSTDGRETLPVWVTPTGTNTYYFDRSLGDLDTGKEYIFTIESGDSLNISPNKSMVVTTTDMPSKEGTLWESSKQYVRYRTDANTGQLRIFGVNKQ